MDLLIKIFCCFAVLFGGTMKDFSHETIMEYYPEATSIVLFNDGSKTIFNKGDDKYEMLIDSLLKISKDAHDMPAFGVSLDEETRKALSKGFWIELVFDGEHEFNEMPFESLLIGVEPEFSGFNLIRKVNGKYDGRCFYLQLMETMQPLYEEILEISKNK